MTKAFYGFPPSEEQVVIITPKLSKSSSVPLFSLTALTWIRQWQVKHKYARQFAGITHLIGHNRGDIMVSLRCNSMRGDWPSSLS